MVVMCKYGSGGFTMKFDSEQVSIMRIYALLLTLLHTHGVVFCDKTPITCNAGIYSAGAPASVVCNFHRDVSVDKLATIVEHFPKGATPNVVGKEVLTCQRSDLVNNYDCKWKDGFQFDGDIKEHLTLRIPFVNATFAGLYRCFTEPAETTDPQLCELNLKAPGRAILQDEGGSGQGWYIVIPIIVVLAVSIIVIVVIYKRCRGRLNCKNQQQESPQNEESSVPMIEPSNRPSRLTHTSKLDIFMKDLKLTDPDYKHVMELMTRDLATYFTGNSQGSVKAYPVQIRSLPRGTDDGTCLVVELSSTKVNVYRVVLLGIQTDSGPHESYDIPSQMRRDKEFKLFSFIADCLKTFLTTHGLSRKKFSLGFVFPFPCTQDEGLTKATVTEWTKGFNCTDVVGEDVGELLQNALSEQFTPCNLDVKTVFSDAVGTLIAVTCTADSSCQIAIMLSNGFEICCKGEGSEEIVLTKLEVGMLGENGCLDGFITNFDREVDGSSMHPGKHILEKMVSMIHIGEVVRQVLRTLIAEDLLFTSLHNKDGVLTKEGAITAAFVSLIESDNSIFYLATKNVLMQLRVGNYTDEDCRTVVHVCQVVLKRAAYFAAAGLAALINRLNQSEVTIAVDGELHRYHPNFIELMRTKTKEFVKPGLKFKLHPLYYGSVIGTALMTVTLTPRTRTSAGV
ncbi:hexokinase-like [Littorina saxatilis]|uniref:hexokinase-like n=1 Tax=Littorina saxatilis TaxID=31220 RepID=UPI0038B44439